MEQIKSELTSLKLSGMAQCIKTLEETRQIYELSFSDGLKMLIQAEKDQRDTNRYARLLKNANFRYQASLEELKIDASRGVDKTKVVHLVSNTYIDKGESILITGATGCGKSFLASALGTQACKHGFSVGYYNMQKLALKLKTARIENTIVRLFEKLAKTDLLIFDDFGMSPLDKQQQLDFMEIIEDRHAKKATVIASQIPVESWFDLFSNQNVADSLIDRIIYTSHRFELKGESLRKKR